MSWKIWLPRSMISRIVGFSRYNSCIMPLYWAPWPETRATTPLGFIGMVIASRRDWFAVAVATVAGRSFDLSQGGSVPMTVWP